MIYVNWLLIGFFSMVRSSHMNNAFVFVNFVEEAPVTNAITPGFWSEIPQLLNIRAEMRFFSQLRVDIASQLLFDTLGASLSNLFEIVLEVFGFENPITIQSFVPFQI